MAVKRKTIKLRNGDILDITENHDGNHGAPGVIQQIKHCLFRHIKIGLL